MIRDLVLDAQTTEPAVRQVDLNLPAEQPLRTDGKNVADDEHPDHQHRVNRRAAARRVVGCKLSTHPGHIEHGGDLAHKVIARYHLVVPKLLEKLLLLVLQPQHHRSPPQRIVSERRNHRSQKASNGLLQQNLPRSRRWETMAYSAAVAAFSINAATSGACERKIAWLPGSSMTCDCARFVINRSRSGLIIRSCMGITA